MRQFYAFIAKETRHITRDGRTMMILFGMPVVMMLLFGFALTTEVRNVRVVVVAPHPDEMTRRMTERLGASEHFTLAATASIPAEAERLMRCQHADMAVVFAPDAARRRCSGDPVAQVMTDCADPNMAIQQSSYALQIMSEELGGGAAAASAASAKLLFNPRMKSAYNFVPGLMGMLLLIICAMMTSVSIVREKERGSMEVLLVSPVRPFMIVTAKAVPYLLLSVIILACILLIARFVLGVPVAGSIMAISGISLLYILLALSLGLLISTVAKTQLVALLASGMVLLLPSILLSGMIYPVESMPEILQYITAVVPARWYISAIRKLMIMGVDIQTIAREVCVLAAMTAFLLCVALLNFKKRLE